MAPSNPSEKDVKKDVGVLSPACFCLTEVLQNAEVFKSFDCQSVAFIQPEIFCYGAKRGKTGTSEAVMIYDYQENIFSLAEAPKDEDNPESRPQGRTAASFVRRKPLKGGSDPEKGVLTLFGGENSASELTDRVWNFDPVAKTWKEVQTGGPRPSARFGHAACTSTNFKTMYVYGGMDQHGVARDDAYVFGEDDIWSELPMAEVCADIPARCFHTLVAGRPARSAREYLLLFGGDSTGSGAASNELWMYSLTSKNWKRVTDASGSPPKARMKHSCVFANNRMWICGGEAWEWLGTTTFKDLYGYDLTLNYWFLCDVFLSKPRNESHNFMLGPIAISSTTRSVIIFGHESDSEGNKQSVIYRATPVCTFAYLSQADSENKTARDSMTDISTAARRVQSTLETARASVDGTEAKIAELEQEMTKVSARLKEAKKAASEIVFHDDVNTELLTRTAEVEKSADSVKDFEDRLDELEAKLDDIRVKVKKKAGKADVRRIERAVGRKDQRQSSRTKKLDGGLDSSSDSSDSS
ncbi:putative kelch motif domain-containing protein [Neospora caninum Liverpool]|uniref:Kelch motif domain-containing protein, putative n=1 Tax=Neospora caninum (strain Liverpool) TaxID=572307 RepID=F0V8D3_NEOCL|nr:putative kelch motif domain-containing protein [Neospora caninum Liverpool]CBZ49974.1 putative kelch motif domain-containing protein [Neospora caninum Liverpool]CEL64562.1 TPA: kelch motif domain-containing protein, putative [Neospora caninum Liverpool]|eukprot:XP_003880009.1 putative kelch motif domain-containing protein [Neospora caninum Liverpool]